MANTHAALTNDYVAEAPMRPMYEQADFVSYRDCYYKNRDQTSGVAYARKISNRRRNEHALRNGSLEKLFRDSPIKYVARQKVLETIKDRAGNLRVLSMPGIQWRFERALFRLRDKLHLPTEIYTVECDAPIFQASAFKMPGKTRGIKQITPHAISTDRIACHYFTTAEAFYH